MNIKHINHSSVLCETSSSKLLTDPWIFSNAFEGWHQYPFPNFLDIKNLFYPEGNLSYVLLSHAHDDHVDDIFLSKLANNVKIIIPKTNNVGFIKRVLNCGISKERVYEVDHNGSIFGEFKISCFFDGGLSSEDYIFLISSEKTTLIHANDNWKSYEEKTFGKIKKCISELKSENIILFSQIGVADSFPLFYENISNEEKSKIIKNKIEIMCESLLSNIKKLSINNGYAYANQSKFVEYFPSNNYEFDPYKIRDQVIKSYYPKIKQLNPSDKIINNSYKENHLDGPSIMDVRLTNLENLFSEYTEKKKAVILPVRFKSNDYKDKDAEIVLKANYCVWNKILNGQINLESIITGGIGFISKPKNYNMKNEYLLLSSFAYVNQNRAKKDLNFFDSLVSKN